MVTRLCIDSGGRILSVAGDWDSFARDNAGLRCLSNRVVGTDIYSHISLSALRSAYRALYRAVRMAKRNTSVYYRCDSPSKKRLMLMELKYNAQNTFIECSNHLEGEKPRAVKLGPRYANEGGRWTVCTMCARTRGPHGDWLAQEELPSMLMDEQARVLLALCTRCHETLTAPFERTRERLRRARAALEKSDRWLQASSHALADKTHILNGIVKEEF